MAEKTTVAALLATMTLLGLVLAVLTIILVTLELSLVTLTCLLLAALFHIPLPNFLSVAGQATPKDLAVMGLASFIAMAAGLVGIVLTAVKCRNIWRGNVRVPTGKPFFHVLGRAP